MSGPGAPTRTVGTTTVTVCRAAAVGPPSYSETFPRDPRSAASGRRLTAAALHAWGLPELEETGRLIVSELVANAVTHAAGRSIRVTVSRPAADRVRIAVIDRSRRGPVLRGPSHEDVRGRGLLVVGALAAGTGTDRFRWGKRVWAELPVGGPPL